MAVRDMGLEVDYLPVGEGEKSGDAIAMRWGYLGRSLPKQRVIVIDGGTMKAGQALVDHIRGYYQTDEVSRVICTHCDADHASGLSVVLEQLQVGKLLMHAPWQHAKNIHKFVTDGRVTKQSFTRRIKGGLETAHELWELARSREIPIVEPFSGRKMKLLGQTIRILGPSRRYYAQLLSKFRCVPRTDPSPDFSPTTSAENNSSAIIFLTVLGHNMMFTGDAGVEALIRAIEFGEQRRLDFSDLDFFHVPHHGSEHNIDSSVLGRMRTRTAFVSAAPDGAPKHPSSEVTNALIDHGTNVYATQGHALRYSVNAPRRPGWIPATRIPYDESIFLDDFRFGVEALPVRVNPPSIEISYRSQPRFPRSSS